MEHVIRYDNLERFCYCNDKLIEGRIRGLVISFFGLGSMEMYSEMDDGTRLAGKDILFVFPYNNPWNWMNPQAVAMTDEIVDVLFEKYHLPEDLPIVSCGGSMGGHSALIYTRYAKRTPKVCLSNCGVCDLVYHYSERPDLPRTIYSAYFHEKGTVQEALAPYSPVQIAAQMPDIEYYIFHCTEDKAVNKAIHSDRFVAAMKQLGRHVTYYEVPGRGHCDLTDEMKAIYQAKMEEYILAHARE